MSYRVISGSRYSIQLAPKRVTWTQVLWGAITGKQLRIKYHFAEDQMSAGKFILAVLKDRVGTTLGVPYRAAKWFVQRCIYAVVVRNAYAYWLYAKVTRQKDGCEW